MLGRRLLACLALALLACLGQGAAVAVVQHQASGAVHAARGPLPNGRASAATIERDLARLEADKRAAEEARRNSTYQTLILAVGILVSIPSALLFCIGRCGTAVAYTREFDAKCLSG